jgi:Tol biopolymer transport system component
VEPVSGPNSSTVLVNGNATNEFLWNPTWSPDGKRIAFRSELAPTGGNTALKMITVADGSVTTVLSKYPYTSFADLDWSRTGSRIAFRSGNPGKLYVVDVDSAAPNPQAVPGAKYDNRSPTWSSDDPATAADETDRFLVFAGKNKSGEKYGIRRVEVSTGRQTILASSTKANLQWPDWRPFPSAFLPSALMAATSSSSLPRQLLSAEVQPLLAEALARWQAAGVDTSGLSNIAIQVADFPGAALGQASGHTIWLDANAAGWGWFVDATPSDDSEFTTPGNQGEQNRMDLLTVLAHEIGHLLWLLPR